MGALEEPVIGPEEGHANGKALVALALGFFAMANVTVFTFFFFVDVDALNRTGLWWLLPFFGLTAGIAAAFIGSIGWIDVRRGVTDRRLFEAQLGTVLGGIAAGAVILMLLVLLVIFVLLTFSFAEAWNAD